jgi:hypothetical protein
MQTSTFRIWFQPGTDLEPFEAKPRDWGGAEEIQADWFSGDGMVVIVAGDGSDLEIHLKSRPDLFKSWERTPQQDFELAVQEAQAASHT